MKIKILLSIILLFISNYVFCQLGFEINTSYSKVKLINAFDNAVLYDYPDWDYVKDEMSFKRLFNYDFKIKYNFDISYNHGISIISGLGTLKCSPNYNYKRYAGLDFFDENYSYSFYLKYITFPLLFQIHSDINKAFHVFYSIGPEIGYLSQAYSNSNFLYFDTYGNVERYSPNTYFDAYGYEFKDKFKYYCLFLTNSAGVVVGWENGLGFIFSINYTRSLEDIEDKEYVDNLGRKVNRFYDYAEIYVGNRPSTILSNLYFNFGISYYFDI